MNLRPGICGTIQHFEELIAVAGTIEVGVGLDVPQRSGQVVNATQEAGLIVIKSERGRPGHRHRSAIGQHVLKTHISADVQQPSLGDRQRAGQGSRSPGKSASDGVGAHQYGAAESQIGNRAVILESGRQHEVAARQY